MALTRNQRASAIPTALSNTGVGEWLLGVRSAYRILVAVAPADTPPSDNLAAYALYGNISLRLDDANERIYIWQADGQTNGFGSITYTKVNS